MITLTLTDEQASQLYSVLAVLMRHVNHGCDAWVTTDSNDDQNPLLLDYDDPAVNVLNDVLAKLEPRNLVPKPPGYGYALGPSRG